MYIIVQKYHRQILLFIDIENNLLFHYNPSTKELMSKLIDNQPGCIIPIADKNDDYLIGTSEGLESHQFSNNNTTGTLLIKRSDLEKKEKNRFNDGKCDPSGRLFVGTMAINCEGTEGSLYCFDSSLSHSCVRTNVGISNGLAWTKDKKTMFYIDSTPKKSVRI